VDHYVQYRNPALVRGDCGEGIGGDFVIGTNKGLVRQLPGNKVWLICGQGRPRRYFLRHWFLVDEVGEVGEADGVSLFRFYAQGRIGQWFQPPLPLDGLPWFHEFRRIQSNFSFGLNPITAPFVAEFERLAAD
jgi:hypothetical protein